MNHNDSLCYISSRESIILSIFERVETCVRSPWTGTTPQGNGNIHFVDL